MVFNLGMSPSFQGQDFKHMVFPAEMSIDYVRVYQLPGVKDGMTCDPPNYPTANYIAEYVCCRSLSASPQGSLTDLSADTWRRTRTRT